MSTQTMEGSMHVHSVWKVMGSIPVRDSDFLFVPLLWQTEYFTFLHIFPLPTAAKYAK